MLLQWLTWAALLTAVSATDASPEELLRLDTQGTVLPVRLLQLLTESGQLQQRQRRLRQTPGFKPWSGKRSGPPAVVRQSTSSGRHTDTEWADKRSNFKPWTGKRNNLKPWTVKRDSFKPWTGKRQSFMTDERGSFKPWTGKRDAYKAWTEAREKYGPWTGKRVDTEDHIETEDASDPQTSHATHISNMLDNMTNLAKRITIRSSGDSKGQDPPRHIVRQRFKPWSGKRSSEADDTTEEYDRIQF